MAKTTLVEADYAAGRELVGALDQSGLAPTAAMWFLFDEENVWRLLLAIPSDKDFPEIYRQIVDLMDEHGLNTKLSADDIALARPDTPLLQLMKTAIQTGPGIAGVRFTHNRINDVLIEDAYIYRLAEQAPTADEPGSSVPPAN
jgi:hypothetical protein